LVVAALAQAGGMQWDGDDEIDGRKQGGNGGSEEIAQRLGETALPMVLEGKDGEADSLLMACGSA
jgi:hypothetical protein